MKNKFLIVVSLILSIPVNLLFDVQGWQLKNQQSVEVDHTYFVIHTSSPFGLKNPAANICEVKDACKVPVSQVLF